MARAVSGGAVYVSDKPGQHDFSLLRKLVLPDGSILRALLPGRPTRDCLFADVLRDRRTLLKVKQELWLVAAAVLFYTVSQANIADAGRLCCGMVGQCTGSLLVIQL